MVERVIRAVLLVVENVVPRPARWRFLDVENIVFAAVFAVSRSVCLGDLDINPD